MPRALSPIRLSPSRTSRALLCALALLPTGGVVAADVFVVETRIEKGDELSLRPTFLVTPGETALLALAGETPDGQTLDVSVTLSPGRPDEPATASADASGDGASPPPLQPPFEVRFAISDADGRVSDRYSMPLLESRKVTLGDYSVELLVREQD